MDGEFDRTVAKRLLSDGVAAAAGFETGFFERVALQELVESGLVAPAATVVVVTDLTGRRVTDDRIPPVRQLDGQTGDGPAVQTMFTLDGRRQP